MYVHERARPLQRVGLVEEVRVRRIVVDALPLQVQHCDKVCRAFHRAPEEIVHGGGWRGRRGRRLLRGKKLGILRRRGDCGGIFDHRFDGGAEPPDVLFRDVVAGAGLQRFDSQFFGPGCGDNNPLHVGVVDPLLADKREDVAPGNRGVGNDDVRPEFGHDPVKHVLRPDTAGRQRKSRLPELHHDHFRIRGIGLEYEDSFLFSHGMALLSG